MVLFYTLPKKNFSFPIEIAMKKHIIPLSLLPMTSELFARKHSLTAHTERDADTSTVDFLLPRPRGSSLCAEVPQSAFVFQQDSAEDKSSWGHQSVGYGELEVEDKTENVVEETNTFFNKMGIPNVSTTVPQTLMIKTTQNKICSVNRDRNVGTVGIRSKYKNSLKGVVTWSSPKLISTISCRVNENLPMVHYKVRVFTPNSQIIEKFSVPRKTDLHKSSGIFTETL
ncbi:Protein CBG27549 [Caenorhabditis briggsae]|uniref:Protein CBG27549 n=1 Tax=Caenorhabditis briggsae TaxID=6238 RepID=B6IKL3_CAEBR|nr:Protein CBG27549 [Caenorhabditis briggsae]CAS00443.1 Protein CBG27549 [Caenorhabditis briggsae]